MYLPLGNIKSKMRTAGFTMIELLVVIAVIGVLAVAVLSSINPIEQINKGRDTRTRSDAAQLINAIDRYFAVHELYPWNDIAYNTILAGTATSNEQFDVAFPNGDNCLGDADAGDFCVVDGTNSTWIDGLVTTGEVKPGFQTRVDGIAPPYQLQVNKPSGANQTIFVCFEPTSLAFREEAVQRCFDEEGELPLSACPNGANTNGDYDGTETWTDELVCLP